MGKIIHRYIFREIAATFILVILVLTFILLMGKILQIVDLFVNRNVGLLTMTELIVFLLPYLMIFTIPIAFLTATLIAIGRLSSDNEINALKTAGVSLLQIYYPVAVASLIAFLLTLLLTYYVVPRSNVATKQLLFDIIQQNAFTHIKEKTFNDDFKDFLIYVNKISPADACMEGIIVSDKRIINEQNTILAQKAYPISDPKSMKVKLQLENGSIHTVKSDLRNYRRIDFQRYEITLDLSTPVTDFDKSEKDMTVRELLEKAKSPGLKDRDVRELYSELHKKFAIPFACIVFGILGLPLGIKNHRSVKSKGFAMGLLIVCFYYVLRLGGEALAETGRLPVIVGIWAPNAFFFLIGAALFYITYNEISLSKFFSIPAGRKNI